MAKNRLKDIDISTKVSVLGGERLRSLQKEDAEPEQKMERLRYLVFMEQYG